MNSRNIKGWIRGLVPRGAHRKGRLIYVNTYILSCVTGRLGQWSVCVCANKCETDAIGVMAQIQNRAGSADPKTKSHFGTHASAFVCVCVGGGSAEGGQETAWVGVITQRVFGS